MSDVDSMMRELEARDAFDAQYLLPHDLALIQDGILPAAIALVPPPATDYQQKIHVNFDATMGVFGTSLTWYRSDLHVLDLHPNRTAASHTHAYCRSIGMQTQSSIRSSFTKFRDNMMQRRYELEYDRLRGANFSSMDPLYWIIHDHVRSAVVVRQILGETKVDSASLIRAAGDDSGYAPATVHLRCRNRDDAGGS